MSKILISNKILKLLSEKPLIIHSFNKSANQLKSKEIFKAGIDLDFQVNYINNEKGIDEETALQVYEMYNKDASFVEIFSSLTNNKEELCLTTNQISSFCANYPCWLRQGGYATFFLFKANSEYYVAQVYVYSFGLGVVVHRFKLPIIWRANYRRRVVISNTN